MSQEDAARRSAFTHRHLSQMASYGPTTPLRVVAHVDLDAFYAQCEMVRLGVAEDVPLAVQQWQGLIAVNYPARNFGITRHSTVTDARKLCPDLVAQHVATWREGHDTWAYRPDAAASVATDKVSLDPYRLESRRVLSLVRESLVPAPLQRVEKASIDEVFMDLSAQVHRTLLDRFPELGRTAAAAAADPSERLPAPSVSALDWADDHLVPLVDEDEESRDPDWDDVALSVGAEIVRGIRAAIRERLGYTCSGGVSHNKLLSKLGSGHHKPAQQTVIRRRAVAPFLAPMKFTKIPNLGGKLGENVVSGFGTSEVGELLSVPLSQMASRLGPETGTWVHNAIRGIDNSEVNPRTKINSMLSAKAFRPPIHSVEQAERWINIFAADIYARLNEAGVLESRRRPRTANLGLKHNGSNSRSRQIPIPPGTNLDQACLVGLGRTLLTQILSGGESWPCVHLSMGVTGFEDGVTGNMGIDSFLVKGTEAQALRDSPSYGSRGSDTLGPAPQMHNGNPERKRRRSGGGGDIGRFFTRPATAMTGHYPDEPANASIKCDASPTRDGLEDDARSHNPAIILSNPTGECPFPETSSVFGGLEAAASESLPPGTAGERALGPTHQCPSHFGQMADETPDTMHSYMCGRCKLPFADPETLQSHSDWHMAMDLQEREERVEERVRSAFASRNEPRVATRRSGRGGRGHRRGVPGGPASVMTSSSRSRGGRGEKEELEPGQRKLKFG